MKSLSKAVLCAALWTAAWPVWPAGAETSPAYYRHHLGGMTITALHDGVLHLPTDDMVNGDAQAIAQALAGSMAVVEKGGAGTGIRTSVNAFLVEKRGERVLVDTGTRDCFQSFAPGLGQVPAALHAAGLAPEGIAHVLLTHAHPDHICGLLDAEGQMAYRKATVWIAAAEHAYWMSDAEKAATPPAHRFLFDQARAALAPYAKAGRLKRFDADSPLPLSIRALPAPGHTAGHTAFLLDGLLLWGDAMHFPAVQFAMPGVHYSADWRGATAQATRESLLQQAAEGRWHVAGAHLPFPGIGKVIQGSGPGDAWRWVPVEYAPQTRISTFTPKDKP